MPLTLGYPEIALRLALTVLAGILLGLNRSERGRPVGLRTTLLVCLAASASMIQANLLLGLRTRPPDSFVMLDLMRLPLGILTGVGFIGAGAILRRGDLIIGVTTAATLWIGTVIGLCFGGGQIALGLTALALAWGILWGITGIENRMHLERRATLTICTATSNPPDEEIRRELLAAGYSILSWDISYVPAADTHKRTLRCEVGWRGHRADVIPPEFVTGLLQRPSVLMLRWRA